MREMDLSYRCLVAFSGTVHDTDNGQDYTEDGMNELTAARFDCGQFQES